MCDSIKISSPAFQGQGHLWLGAQSLPSVTKVQDNKSHVTSVVIFVTIKQDYLPKHFRDKVTRSRGIQSRSNAYT